uniref:SAC3/GANP/THP3 conserved domain-containing protein n=1 Tax=Anopheles atroparvus TaxID=41427 RepID=A0AAG5DYE1_ANOAO
MSNASAIQTRAELSALANRRAETPEARFRALEVIDRYVRLTTVRTTDIRRNIVGTCPDMCPEKERYLREWKGMVPPYERHPASNQMDHRKAIKEYSRSSADQELPLPHELRTEHALGRTMYFILANHADRIDGANEEEGAANVSDWFHYIWDRTRGIRKDITQQDLCSLTVVGLVQQCARFHIHCAARLANEDPSVFDQKINTENLTKCLQTLKYLYADLKQRGIQCPDEGEFRAYMMLLYLNEGSFQTELRGLSAAIIHSNEVKFALSVHLALVHNDYVRFFKMVRQASYMNACILLRYFTQIRLMALNVIRKAYVVRSAASFELAYLVRLLGFDDEVDAMEFFVHFGVNVDRTSGLVTFEAKQALHSEQPYAANRSLQLVESKRNCSVGEAICGAPLDQWGAQFPPVPCVTSFDEDSFPQHQLLNELFGSQRAQRGGEMEQQELIEKMASHREMDIEDDMLQTIDELLLKEVFSCPEIEIQPDELPVFPEQPDWYELRTDQPPSIATSGALAPVTLAQALPVPEAELPMETDLYESTAYAKPSATVGLGGLVSCTDGVKHDFPASHSDSTTTMEYPSPPASTQIAPAGRKRTFFGAVKAPSNSFSPMSSGSDRSLVTQNWRTVNASSNLPSQTSPGSLENSSSASLSVLPSAPLVNTQKAPAGHAGTELSSNLPSVMPPGSMPGDSPSALLIPPWASPSGTVNASSSRASIPAAGSLGSSPGSALASPSGAEIRPAAEASFVNSSFALPNETKQKGTPLPTPFAESSYPRSTSAKRPRQLEESMEICSDGEAISGAPLLQSAPPVPSLSYVPAVPEEVFGRRAVQIEQESCPVASPEGTTPSAVIDSSVAFKRADSQNISEPLEQQQQQVRPPLEQQQQQVHSPLDQQQLAAIENFQANRVIRLVKKYITKWCKYATSRMEMRQIPPWMEKGHMPPLSRIFPCLRYRFQNRRQRSVTQTVQDPVLLRHLLPFESFTSSELIDPFEVLSNTVWFKVGLDLDKLRSVQPLCWKLVISVPSELDSRPNFRGFPCFIERWLSECSFSRKPLPEPSNNGAFFLEARENSMFGRGFEHHTAICMRLVRGERSPRDESGGIPFGACKLANGIVFFLEERVLKEDITFRAVYERLEAVLSYCDPLPSAVAFLCYAPPGGTNTTDIIAQFKRSLGFLRERNISYKVYVWIEPSKTEALRQALLFLAKAYCRQVQEVSETGKCLEMLPTPVFLSRCIGAELWYRLEQLSLLDRELVCRQLARIFQDGNGMVKLFKHALTRALELVDKERLLKHTRLPEDFDLVRKLWINQLATLRMSRPRLPEAYFPPNWKQEDNNLFQVSKKLLLHTIPPQLLAAIDRAAEAAAKCALGIDTTELTEQLRNYIANYRQHLDATQQSQLVSHLRLSIVIQLSGCSNKLQTCQSVWFPDPMPKKRELCWVPLLSSIAESLMNALLAKGQLPSEVYFIKAEFDRHISEEWWMTYLYSCVERSDDHM